MSLSHVCIQRPVLSIVLSMAIALFGAIGFLFLGVREYPSVDPPVVTVTTTYAGANADVMLSQITEPLEDAINGVAGVRSIASTSTDGRSVITVEFTLETDLDVAANDVRDKVAQAIRRLPPDVDPPVVAKADANASPILILNLKSDSRHPLEISAIATNILKERLQTINGVSEIQIWGEKKYSMRLWMSPEKLAAYGLTPLDAQAALNRENVELPTGRLEGDKTELTVRAIGRLTKPEEFEQMILREDGGRAIRFGDVGRAELYPENERTILRRDGVMMVACAVIPQPGANHIQIADEVYKRLEHVKKELPSDFSLAVAYDSSKFIRASIREVIETLCVAFALVVFIIFLFLRDWRTTLIPSLAIPISLIGAFFVMYLFGFSINVLTLLGLALAIGIVVDDAIVVLENIYAKIERGEAPLRAAQKGASEIFFAVVATTVVLVAVFLPVVFLQGLTGRLFREFGVVVAGAVVISSFVALTLTPMLCSRLLKRRSQTGKFYAMTEPLFNALAERYRCSLKAFLRRRWLAFPIVASCLALIALFGALLPSELTPNEDRGVVRLFATAPEGASFEYVDAFMRALGKTLEELVPEKEAIITVTSPSFGASAANTGFARAFLKPREERSRSQQEIVDDLSQKARSFSQARVFVSQEQAVSNPRGGLPVQFVLQAPSLDALKEALPKFLNEARKSPVFNFVDVNLKFNKPELKVEIDRDRARALGVSVADVAQILQASYSGQRFGFFIMDGKQYQIIGQVERGKRDAPIDLQSLFARNSRGELVQLDNVVKLAEQSAPPQLFRYNRYLSATVQAGLAPGKTIGDGVAEMRRIAQQTLDERFVTALDGPSKDYEESSSSLLFAFILALMLIYLALAAQFESFRDPFIILFTVPLALAGTLLALWYFNQTLNIFSQIGIIMLIGLVTKNGILIVEFANQRKFDGLSKADAVEDAAVQRFRPILMTSLSTILGFAPVAMALGAGSESRVSMGIAVVFGMMFSSVLALYVVPAMYSYLSTERRDALAPVAPLELIEEK
ncbi:MAG: efflux RND transporter permease subunit [Chloroherpetonaceae bacterium]|nr:efflux RND transporter permease subunit [Chloroherpetonaceae bacterium]MDW8436523.1 efflux RND transporter permease subunit [Chloroherpetonaceae bacterium]